MSRSRRWCWTAFGELPSADPDSSSDSEEEVVAASPCSAERFQDIGGRGGEALEGAGGREFEGFWLLLQRNHVLFVLFQEEEAPETKRRHWQGYMRFSAGKSLSAVRRIIPGAHFEVARGTEEENISYCSKAATRIRGPYEFGRRASPGKRKDIDEVKEIVVGGGNMREVCTIARSYQSIKVAEVMLKFFEEPRNWLMDVKWFHGSTGSGKTVEAFRLMPDDRWVSARNLRWFEGYDGHSNVIIDDFRGDFCTFHELLRILDTKEYRIEIKCSSRQLRARNIIITSPYHPREVYKNRSQEDINQLLRRINEIRLFGEPVHMAGPSHVADGFV